MHSPKADGRASVGLDYILLFWMNGSRICQWHSMWHIRQGASEIYLDGKLLYSFGKVGTRKEEEEPYWERNPQVISFSGETDHVIAVRYSNFSSYQSIPVQGFRLTVARLNESIRSRVGMVRQGTTYQMVWTAIPVFLMLQHLLLFFFYPRARENLYFALLTGSFGAFFFLLLQCVLASYSN